jgi:hypothetical protein
MYKKNIKYDKSDGLTCSTLALHCFKNIHKPKCKCDWCGMTLEEAQRKFADEIGVSVHKKESYAVPKIIGWICAIIALMIGMNNIDSLFSAFLQHETCAKSMYAQSLLIGSANPSTLYHTSVVMIIGAMLIMTAVFLFEMQTKGEIK